MDPFNKLLAVLVTSLMLVGVTGSCEAPTPPPPAALFSVSTSSLTSSSAPDVPMPTPSLFQIASRGEDQTDEIQKVLDVMSSRGYGEVVFRAGPQSRVIKLRRMPNSNQPYSLILKEASNIIWRCEAGVVFERIDHGQGKEVDFAHLWIVDGMNIRIEGCGWDGGLARPGRPGVLQGEQSHVIDLRAEKLGVDSVWITDNDFAWYRGDAVRLLGKGDGGPPVKHVWILNNAMRDNQRSGVGIQRNVHNVEIVGNECWNCSDQCVDFEPSGKTAGWVSNITIAHNHFGPTAAFSVTIAGIKGVGDFDQRATRNIRVAHNTMGPLNVLWSSNVVVEGNIITSESRGNAGIQINGEIEEVLLSNNIVRSSVREGIQAASDHGGMGRGLKISGNMVTGPQNSGIVVRSLSDVTIEGNQVVGSVKVEAERPGMKVEDVLISGNTIQDPDTCLRILGRDNGISGAVLDGNVCRAPKGLDARGLVSVECGQNFGLSCP